MTLDYSGITLPPLWTLAEIKVHLKVRDALHDEDIAQKLDAAQEEILAMLGAAADPTWTATTAPKKVRNAIALLTAHYYVHRGDDMSGAGSSPDAAVREAIRQALCYQRDPALA